MQSKKIHKKFFLSLFLMGIVFLLTEYRLLYTMFIDTGFISHRTEFNIFFQENLLETYRLSLVQFLFGNVPHAQSLQKLYILPIVITTLLLTFLNRRLTAKESLVIWSLLIISLLVPFWDTLLIHKLTLPSLILLSLYSFIKHKKYKRLPLLLIIIIFLSLLSMTFKYKGFEFITEIFPIFKALNMTRLNFIQPFLFAILLVFSSIVLYKKLHFTSLFMLTFIIGQSYLSYTKSAYQWQDNKDYASFETYYAPKAFKALKESIPLEDNPSFISYAIEPAVALYNGLYTVDGYAVNYPLPYKHKFKKVFLNSHTITKAYKYWGSKVYINVPHEMKYYQKGLKISNLKLNTPILCELNTSYILSPYYFKETILSNTLSYINKFQGKNNAWDIYLYKINCIK